MLYLPLTATEQSYKIIGTDNEKNNFFHLIDPLNHSYPRTFYIHRIKKLTFKRSASERRQTLPAIEKLPYCRLDTIL